MRKNRIAIILSIFILLISAVSYYCEETESFENAFFQEEELFENDFFEEDPDEIFEEDPVFEDEIFEEEPEVFEENPVFETEVYFETEIPETEGMKQEETEFPYEIIEDHMETELPYETGDFFEEDVFEEDFFEKEDVFEEEESLEYIEGELDGEIENAYPSGICYLGGFSPSRMRKLYGVSGFNGSFGSQLSGGEADMYQAMQTAWGNYGTGSFTVNLSTPLTFTVNQAVDSSYMSSGLYKSTEGYENCKAAIRGYVQGGMDAFLYDFPQIYWFSYVSFGYTTPSYEVNGNMTTFTMTKYVVTGGAEAFSGAKAGISAFVSAVDNAVSNLSGLVSREDSLARKIDVLNCYVMNHCTYADVTAAHTAYGVFNGGQAVCEGYAKAFKILCDRYSIPCILVCGDAYTGSGMGAHMWNYVQMNDGLWYLVDVTWNDSLDNNMAYFLMGSGSDGCNGLPINQERTNYNTFSVSDYSRTFTFPALSAEPYHDWELIDYKTATCMEEGYNAYMCLLHGEEKEDILPITDHQMSEWETVKERTCLEDGLEKRSCIWCGMEESRIIESYGSHDFDTWEVVEEGNCLHNEVQRRECRRCLFEEEREIDTSDKHSPGGRITTKEASCKEEGSYEIRCALCNTVLESGKIAKTDNHRFGSWVITKEPTRQEEGQEERICRVCGKAERRAIEKLPLIPLPGASYNVKEQTFTGQEIIPEIVITCEGAALVKNKDYTISFKNNVNAGTASFTAKGTGDYTGSISGSFVIRKKDIAGSVLSVSDTTYTGNALTPNISVKLGTKTLTKDTDYTLSLQNNVNAGTASVTVTGKGNYAGSVKGSFVIKPQSIAGASFNVSGMIYAGSERKPAVKVMLREKVLQGGLDYTVSYKNNTNAGTASFTVTGKGNYTGTVSGTFVIGRKNLSGASLKTSPCTYTGSALKPAVTVTLEGKTLTVSTDYTVSYKNNVNAGTTSYTITGMGNYTGSASGTFVIGKKNLSGASLKTPACTYNGSVLKPAITVTLGGKTLTAGTDYAVSYKNNVNAGSASYTVTGKGNYTGSVSGSFVINKKNLSGSSLKVSACTYTGNALKPAVNVTLDGKVLTAGTDYTVSYKNNVNAGTASFTVTGKGNYAGNTGGTFSIKRKSIAGAKVGVNGSVYDGNAKKPSPSVILDGKTLVKNKDYTVSYQNNVKAGTAKVIISGTGNYTGTAAGSFVISKCFISKATTKDLVSSLVYNGKARKPSFSIQLNGKTLVPGTDYTNKRTDNINVGTSSITVTGKGNYTGTKIFRFQILPRTPSGISVKKESNGKICVNWKPRKEAGGVQIQYSFQSSFSSKKTKTIRNTTDKTVSIKTGTSGKYAYVRIRSYLTKDGKNYYSSWSDVKKTAVK